MSKVSCKRCNNAITCTRHWTAPLMYNGLKPHDCSGLKCHNRELTIVPEEPVVSAHRKKWSNKSPSSSVITSVGRNLYKFCLERLLLCLFSNVKLLSCSASVLVWVESFLFGSLPFYFASHSLSCSR